VTSYAYRGKPPVTADSLCSRERANRQSSWENRYPLPANYIPFIRQQIFRAASYLTLRRSGGTHAAKIDALQWVDSRRWTRVGRKLGFPSYD
jgi:hypothetical protein